MTSLAAPSPPANPGPGLFRRALPGFSLMVLAPLVAELLPGATRISSAFVFPIEVIIWGGGAVIARDLVRRMGLGWGNLLLLALALSIAEECLIQQTSFAPLVINIQGVPYGRIGGVNWVYFAWALIYESLFVVLIPVALTELIFPARRDEPWLNGWGHGVIGLLMLPACFGAWYGWNIVARVEVFHLAPYRLPLHLGLAGVTALLALIGLAVGPWRHRMTPHWRALTPPPPLLLALGGLVIATLILGLEVLAFGIAPAVPVPLAILLALIIAAACLIVPRWQASAAWQTRHRISLLYGAMIGNCAVLTLAMLDAGPVDFYGRIILCLIALGGLVWLARARLTG